MIKETDTEMILALKLAVEWASFKNFCRSRTECTGCAYLKEHVCSYTSTDKIMTKIAKAAKKYLESEEAQA